MGLKFLLYVSRAKKSFQFSELLILKLIQNTEVYMLMMQTKTPPYFGESIVTFYLQRQSAAFLAPCSPDSFSQMNTVFH